MQHLFNSDDNDLDKETAMTYDYECNKCGSSYTVERGIRDAEVLPVCVTCHESMTRVWSAPTVVFNAPGFYSTDNKR